MVVFIVYLAILFKITVFRSNFSFSHLFHGGKIELEPFLDLINVFKTGPLLRFIYFFVGNIVWFVPFGAYLKYQKKDRSIVMICLFGLSLSLIIETLQYVFGTGVSEVDDLILNTFGTFVGAFFYKNIHMHFEK